MESSTLNISFTGMSTPGMDSTMPASSIEPFEIENHPTMLLLAQIRRVSMLVIALFGIFGNISTIAVIISFR